MSTPEYTLGEAMGNLDAIISWAIYHANAGQLAQLRGVRQTLARVKDPNTRMELLMEEDGKHAITERA